MLPHDVSGGCTPKPRNDSVDSVMIASATPSVAFTMIGPTMFGRMWRTMIRARRRARRAGRLDELLLLQRQHLAAHDPGDVHPEETGEHEDDRRRRCGPSFSSAMARIAMPGTMRNRSVTRISSWSVALPKNPATAPTVVPTTVEISATANPIFSEIWPA